jgi:hypothetical protein
MVDILLQAGAVKLRDATEAAELIAKECTEFGRLPESTFRSGGKAAEAWYIYTSPTGKIRSCVVWGTALRR